MNGTTEVPRQQQLGDELAVESTCLLADSAAPETTPAADNKLAEASFRTTLDRFRHIDGEDAVTQPIAPTIRVLRKRAIPTIDSKDGAQSPSPSKKLRRESSRYAPPSQYAHLAPLTDILEPNLIGVFVGFNPGVTTASTGHAYAHPSNMFWKLLHSSGITGVRLRPEQDRDLPRLCQMGNTNIVERPSRNAGELSKKEVTAGAPVLDEKIRVFRPEAVCIVGKSIWEAIWRWRYQREIKKDEFRYGWQDEKEKMGQADGWRGSWVFVAPATSGLNASLKPPEKEALWRPFGEWVQQRREERRAK